MDTTNGIDVSQYQGVIDWEEAKNHIDFAILRCGYGQDLPGQDDKQFKRNADECTRLNIPFGVYLYSYAKNVADARGEAQHVLRLIKGYKLKFPVYYDLEDEGTTGKQSNQTIANIAETFANILEDNRYFVGMYASLYWWKTKLTDPIFNRYTRWIANYASELNYDGKYDMWQYSSTGFIPGIEGDVDLNYCYVDFPAIIVGLGFNGFGRPTQPNPTVPVRPTYKVGDTVRFNYVFLTSESDTPLKPYRNTGRITRIEAGKRNPYLIGNDQGWVNDQVIEQQVRYLSNPNYMGDSFVNALAEIGADISFANRSRLASLNGIENYQGTARQNLQLLKLLKEGKLIS